MTENILIIDDEDQLRKLIGRIISLEGFSVNEASTLKQGMDLLKKKDIDVILCDVKLPDGNGVEFVKSFKYNYPLKEIIILTAFGNISDGVQAIKNGAFDYIVKGNDNDKIIPLLSQAVERVRKQIPESIKITDSAVFSFDDILGQSTQIKNAVSLAKKISVTDSNVLLLGETGTGKEVFANAIHSGSKRSAHQMVTLNCSAFTRDLLEGELFGHKAGAYTGAMKDKKGLIEMANQGTLFLDEIGELNIDLQAKLLRVIETGNFIKLGDTKETHVDVRFIAATNRDLEKMTETGEFRRDLYYRLNVFSIVLPGLRDRPEDIQPLAEYFIKKFSKKLNIPAVPISKEVINLLKAYPWNGNARELRNIMERALILSDNQEIRPEHLPYGIQANKSSIPHNLSLSSVEKNHIEKVLQYTKGNKTKAAELLGIGLTTLYRKMEEYQVH